MVEKTIKPIEQLSRNVRKQVSTWGKAATEHGGGATRSEALSSLAALRRSSVEDLAQNAKVWGAVVQAVPPELQGKPASVQPSKAEVSTFIAFMAFAVHQQSQSISMHKTGVPLAKALGRLAQQSAHSGPAMTRRFGALVTAEGMEERANHLRSLVSLLRTAKSGEDSQKMPLQVDYGDLAKDIFLLASPKAAPGIRLKWGRNFSQVTSTNKENGS